MKKIINGKMYNTETAKELGSWDNGYPVNDFCYFCETLYRKRSCEYFLEGHGAANSKYGVLCAGAMRCYGEKIMPLTEAEAREWAEEHLDADEYEAIFGECEE